MKKAESIIAISYLIFGLLWIFLSDIFVEKLSSSSINIIHLQNAKGIFFIVITSIGLYLLVKRYSTKEEHLSKEYKSLFKNNPNPMWIYDPENLAIKAVNNIALIEYGYSKKEFLNLNILDLYASSENDKIHSILNQHQAPSNANQYLHKKKNGTQFYVRTFVQSIYFNNKKAFLASVFNVNEQIVAAEKIKKQNEQLNQIAFMQAHELRGPLANILGLLAILNKNQLEKNNKEIIDYIESASIQLDQKVHEIVEVSQDKYPSDFNTPYK